MEAQRARAHALHVGGKVCAKWRALRVRGLAVGGALRVGADGGSCRRALGARPRTSRVRRAPLLDQGYLVRQAAGGGALQARDRGAFSGDIT